MPVLMETKGLSGGYHDDIVVKNINLRIISGDFLGIIGPNGSGKSTLLRLMTKALVPRNGSVWLDGKDVSRLGLKDFTRKVAFVPQDTIIAFPFTVEEIVLMGRIPHMTRLQSETKEDRAIAERSLSLTDCKHLMNKNIDELSSGERQRVIIAKALAQEPALLFLDEPTSHLDIGHQIQILDLLKKFNRENGITVVIVLHDLNLASEYCENILLLDKGAVFAEGHPDDVLTYQNIEAVYKTVVVVKKNPMSSRPCVFTVPGESVCRPR